MTKWRRVGREVITGPKTNDSYRLTVMVLDGASFSEAGKKFGISKQAAHERFNLTVVKPPFTIISYGNVKNINILRERWNSFNVA